MEYKITHHISRLYLMPFALFLLFTFLGVKIHSFGTKLTSTNLESTKQILCELDKTSIITVHVIVHYTHEYVYVYIY